MDPVQAANDAMHSGQLLLLLVVIGIPALFLAIVFISEAAKRRARERERHLRALERIAKASEDQVRRDR